MALFRTQVLGAPVHEQSEVNVITVLESVILDMIAMERNNEIIDRPLIRACVFMLEGLYETYQEDENSKLYLTSFEPKFIETSRVFYNIEGQDFVTNADAGTFCRHAKNRLREEDERCQQTLSILTDQKIKNVVDKELIGGHIRDVINMEGTGVRHMLDNDRMEDLQNVFDLNSRVDPKKAALKDAVQKRIVALGWDINNNNSSAAMAAKPAPAPTKKDDGEKAPPEKSVNQQTVSAIRWVDEVLELKAKYDRIWEEAFKKDSNMEKALEYSFQEFINANHRSSEHLSLYLDEYLKKGAKGKTDTEVDANLDKGILLLQYIQDKDHFETYYKKHLSKRLLMKKFASMDIERQMISKMKMKVGNTFTQRLESMFKDMALSDDLNKQYKQYVSELGDPDKSRVDMEATILTTTMWPVESMVKVNEDGSKGVPCIYPPALENVRKRFEQFYMSKHSGRALSWQPQLGGADIRLTFTKANGKMQRHELNTSTYAMVILLLFNDVPDGQCLTYEEIQARTAIPDNELGRNLQSLAVAPKTRVLRKEPMSKEVNSGDKFYFNENFTSPYLKVKIGVVSNAGSKAENVEERRATKRKADEERGTTIEAAIVRIMKYVPSSSLQMSVGTDFLADNARTYLINSSWPKSSSS
jgi:cullin 3